MPTATVGPLVLACGALASELRAALGAIGLADEVEVRHLPANLHNRPERIVPTLEPLLAEATAAGRRVLVAYADCGTGGALDRLLAGHPGVARLPGAHCYEFFAGAATFEALHEAEPGTFYLTDFLAKHFDALVWQGLGLDRHPQLRDAYFGNYRRVVLLAQSGAAVVTDAAHAAAARLGLPLEVCHTGLGHLTDAVAVRLAPAGAGSSSSAPTRREP